MDLAADIDVSQSEKFRSMLAKYDAEKNAIKTNAETLDREAGKAEEQSERL